MATEFDLAERAGVSVDAVRAWLKRRGCGGRRGQRIKPSIERAFLDAHGEGSAAQIDPTRSPPRPPPLSRTKPAPRAPAEPSPLVRAQAQRIAALQRELADLQAALSASQAALKAAQERATAQADVQAARAAEAPVAASTSPADVRSVLAGQGLAGRPAHQAVRLALTQQPERLLSALLTTDPSVFAQVQPVCPVVVCRQVAKFDGWHAVDVGARQCAVCRGSDNRRWFRLMAARLIRARRARMLIVGGGPDSHADLRRLAREVPRLDIQIIDGERSPNTRRAKALVSGVDVVVFWASTLLSHAVSDAVKKPALAAPNLLHVVTPTGGRGVATLCRAVVGALDAHTASGGTAKDG